MSKVVLEKDMALLEFTHLLLKKFPQNKTVILTMQNMILHNLHNTNRSTIALAEQENYRLSQAVSCFLYMHSDDMP